MVIEIETPSDPLTRFRQMIAQYFSMPDGTDIAISGGEADNRAAVLVKIGNDYHAFYSNEARVASNLLEEAMNKFPESHEAHSVPNLILGLRAAADAADKLMGDTNENHRSHEAREGQQGEDHRSPAEDRAVLRSS